MLLPKVFRYEPGGALIIEDAGTLASQALKADPVLRLEYKGCQAAADVWRPVQAEFQY